MLIRLILFTIFLLPVTVQAQEKLTSGLIAGDSARGTVARNMAHALSPDVAVSETDLFNTFMQVREQFEDLLATNGFAKGDIATAYGVYVVTLWELANSNKRPLDEEVKVVKYWTRNFDASTFDKLSAAERDQFHDFLLHIPIILATLHDLANRAGNSDLANAISQEANEYFVLLVRFPATSVVLQQDGGFEVNETALKEFLKSGDAEAVERFLKRHRSQDEIDTFLQKRDQFNASGKSNTRSSKHRRKIERNAFRAFPEILLY